MRHQFFSIALCLSLITVVCVFWYLKLTGITLAGEAFCGIDEHVHSEECADVCELTEHVHIESCYSDITADIETADDWEASLAQIERQPTTAGNVVLVAQSQLGNKESEQNFQVTEDGVRRGITRYGQWYGNPYGDWSAMFASFCLYYSGADSVPTNAGAESMRLEWESEGIYKTADEYSPMAGNLLFIGSDKADAVAIITSVTDDTVTAVQGDVDGEVKEVTYAITDSAILGYGLVPESSEFAVLVQPPETADSIATTAAFDTSMLTSTSRFVIYTYEGGGTYAIDGAGNAVQVLIDENGKIRTDHENPDMLLWTFSWYNSNSTAIQNVGSGRYLHPYYNGANDNGITTPGRWGTTVSASGAGVKFSHSAYIGQDIANGRFIMTRTQSQNVTFYIGISNPCTIWFDGTNGGIMSLGGSDDSNITAYTDSVITLPSIGSHPKNTITRSKVGMTP